MKDARQLRKGDAVKARKALYEQFPRMSRLGTVAATPRRKDFVTVRLFGQASSRRYHATFWRRLSASELAKIPLRHFQEGDRPEGDQ